MKVLIELKFEEGVGDLGIINKWFCNKREEQMIEFFVWLLWVYDQKRFGRYRDWDLRRE